MNMLFLFLYVVNGLMALTTYGASIDFKTTKPIICTFWGNKLEYKRPETPVTEASNLPKECEVILMTGFGLSSNSTVAYTEKYLDAVLKLNRSVILEVARENLFKGWSSILTPEGNEKDAKALTDFAISKGIAGVLLLDLTPEEDDDVADGSVAKNIIPYLCQLKVNDDFIVGVALKPYLLNKNLLLDPNVIDFETMNPLVDFYVVDTLKMYDDCKLALFNGLSPIKSINGIDGIDTVVTEICESKIAVDRIYLISTLLVVDPDENSEYLSHSEVCTTTKSTIRWCAPTTKDYYDKGKYFHEQNFGVLIKWPELDDVNNSCGCCPFIAIINIAAGYKGEQQIPCTKFDIKNTTI